VKPAEVDPWLTVTLAGTVRLALLLESGTLNPPTGAAPVKEAVHDVLAGVLSMVDVQLSPLNATDGAGRVIVPDPPTAVMGVPATVDAPTPVSVTPMEVVEGLAAIWNVAMATTPSAKVLVLNPKARQVSPEQSRLLPAFVVDGPAATERRLTSDEWLKLHCSPAGEAPPDRLTARLTVPPGTPDADPRLRETVCPRAIA
jgi:hypothetical protein